MNPYFVFNQHEKLFLCFCSLSVTIMLILNTFVPCEKGSTCLNLFLKTSREKHKFEVTVVHGKFNET